MRRELVEAYGRAPIWAQNAMCSLEGLRLHRQRYTGDFSRRYHCALGRALWRNNEIAAYRLMHLRRVLTYAARQVPYWREQFRHCGFEPTRIMDCDELSVLPVLTKGVVITQGTRMLTQRRGGTDGSTVVRTSGTTGAGLQFRCSPAALHEQWAVCWRYRAHHGLSLGTWCAQLGGRAIVPADDQSGPFFRTNVAGRQLLLSSYHLGPATAAQYLDVIEERRLPWIHGYPSMVVQLAVAAIELNRRLPDLRWVTLASESVTQSHREVIRQAFSLEPREHYAQSEGVANISECPEGRLHVDEDYSHVEFVPHCIDMDGRQLYRIVGTSLHNWHQPFIRYDTGDLAILAQKQTCSCGLQGRIVEQIDGRKEDLLLLRNGARAGRVDSLFKGLEFIREAQVRQDAAGHIVFLVVPRSRWTLECEHILRREIVARLGSDLDMEIQLAEQLQRDPSGKLRLVVREMGASACAASLGG